MVIIVKEGVKSKYLYLGEVLRVIDGDTFNIRVDVGFHTFRLENIRLMGVNTPEIRGKERPEGLKVKEYVKQLIEGKKVLIETFKKGKYGRYVCEIYLGGKDDKQPLSENLLQKGYAKKVTY